MQFGDVAEWEKYALLHISPRAKRGWQPRCHVSRKGDNLKYIGDVAEWLKALVSKTSNEVTCSRVQISPSPQKIEIGL